MDWAGAIRLLDLCFDLALGTAKRNRRAAQDLLSTRPDVERATAVLADGARPVRSVAAEWLGRIGHPDALPALAAEVERERNEAVCDAVPAALAATAAHRPPEDGDG